MAQSLMEKVIETMQITSTALERHEKEASDRKVQSDAIAKEIPETVDLLLRFGLILPNEKEACTQALADHGKTLALLKLAAKEVGGAGNSVAPIGQPVDKNARPAQQKQASVNSRDLSGGGYVGRRTPEPPESWNRLAQGLGVG
jgi:hypothetical protein